MSRTVQNSLIRMGFAAALLCSAHAGAQIVLGTAAGFGVLGGSTVTNTGPTIVNADVGVSPGAAVVGFPPGIIANGILHAADAVAGQAQTDLTTAYNAIAGTACNVNLTAQDLGGQTLTPGVYCFDTSAALTGALTLNALNNPNALFIFKMGSTLTTASASTVTVINGNPCNKVYWQVGTSATLGTGSTFAGDILALASITLTTSASTSGRLLARNGAVTLDSNNVNSCAVAIAPPTLTTTASPNIVLGAGNLSDSATVTGRVNPIGASTITFRLYGPNDTNCTNPPIFAPPAVAYPLAGGPVTSPTFTPTAVGTYRWIAAYSGDGANPPVAGLCNAPNESTIVAPPGPTLATMASPNIVLGAGSLTDSATVSGRTNPIGASTITFRLYGPNDINCTAAAVFAPAAVSYPIAGGPVTSPAFTPTLPGTYRWIASYSGDGVNPPVTGLCNDINESAIVTPPSPLIVTLASPNIVLGAGSLSDTATVTGRVNPIGASTITFRLYGPNDINCTNPPVFAPAAVVYPIGGGPVTSPTFVPTLAGTYRWIASYSGDGVNLPSTGACNDVNESAIVAPPGPRLATMASPAIVLGAGTLIDTATVTGRVNPIGASTITFRLYGPNDTNCANPAVFAPAAVAYPIAGGPLASPPFTPTLAGTYRWIASYSGDGTNPPVAGLCNDINENVIVSAQPALAATAITSQASPAVTVGSGVISDTATVTGRVNALAGATITFRLYGPVDPSCTGAPVFTSTVAQPVGDGPVTSGAFTPTVAGTYRWIASYSGDANNLAVAGPCNAPGENVTVLAAAAVGPPAGIPTLGVFGLLLLMMGLVAAAAIGLKRAR